MFNATLWVFSSRRRRYISFSWLRKNHFSSKWIQSPMSWYFVGSSRSLKCIAILTVAHLFSSVNMGLQCTQMVDTTIQQCTVVFDTPINVTSFCWVCLFLSGTFLTPSCMNSVKYLGALPEFSPAN